MDDLEVVINMILGVAEFLNFWRVIREKLF